MNTTKLKLWKEQQLVFAEAVIKNIPKISYRSITSIYPEFNFHGVYTTSLDPYVPLWALLPFFDSIIVGITPYFKSEDDFKKWYGVSVRQLLSLWERGRVNIRILFPSGATSTPAFMNEFFSGRFPSSARDMLFDKYILGEEHFDELQYRFQHLVGDFRRDKSLDGFSGHKRRAFKTAQTAYVQLHAFGYIDTAKAFESIWHQNQDQAFQWLELARLFLIGPIHYSLNGIHCVAGNVPWLFPSKSAGTIRFPMDLGRILVEALKLLRFEDKQGDFTFEDTIEMYSDYEFARKTLFELDSAVKNGIEKNTISCAEDLCSIIKEARNKKIRWLRWIRIAASTGIGIVTAPLHWGIGLLSGLGFEIATESAGQKCDRMIEKAGKKIGLKFPTHLTLLIDLDNKVREYYRG